MTQRVQERVRAVWVAPGGVQFPGCPIGRVGRLLGPWAMLCRMLCIYTNKPR